MHSLLWWQTPEGSRDIQVGEASGKLHRSQEGRARALPEAAHSAFPYLSVFCVWLLGFIFFDISVT